MAVGDPHRSSGKYQVPTDPHPDKMADPAVSKLSNAKADAAEAVQARVLQFADELAQLDIRVSHWLKKARTKQQLSSSAPVVASEHQEAISVACQKLGVFLERSAVNAAGALQLAAECAATELCFSLAAVLFTFLRRKHEVGVFSFATVCHIPKPLRTRLSRAGGGKEASFFRQRFPVLEEVDRDLLSAEQRGGAELLKKSMDTVVFGRSPPGAPGPASAAANTKADAAETAGDPTPQMRLTPVDQLTLGEGPAQFFSLCSVGGAASASEKSATTSGSAEDAASSEALVLLGGRNAVSEWDVKNRVCLDNEIPVKHETGSTTGADRNSWHPEESVLVTSMARKAKYSRRQPSSVATGDTVVCVLLGDDSTKEEGEVDSLSELPDCGLALLKRDTDGVWQLEGSRKTKDFSTISRCCFVDELLCVGVACAPKSASAAAAAGGGGGSPGVVLLDPVKYFSADDDSDGLLGFFPLNSAVADLVPIDNFRVAAVTRSPVPSVAILDLRRANQSLLSLDRAAESMSEIRDKWCLPAATMREALAGLLPAWESGLTDEPGDFTSVCVIDIPEEAGEAEDDLVSPEGAAGERRTISAPHLVVGGAEALLVFDVRRIPAGPVAAVPLASETSAGNGVCPTVLRLQALDTFATRRRSVMATPLSSAHVSPADPVRLDFGAAASPSQASTAQSQAGSNSESPGVVAVIDDTHGAYLVRFSGDGEGTVAGTMLRGTQTVDETNAHAPLFYDADVGSTQEVYGCNAEGLTRFGVESCR